MGEDTKIEAPKDALVFSIGEVMQIISGGILEASPISVRRCKSYKQQGLTRNSFALRFKPTFDYKLTVPPLIGEENVLSIVKPGVPSLSGRWHNGINYGDFVVNSLNKFIRPKY